MSGRGDSAAVQELLKRIKDRFGISSEIFEKFAIYERKKGEFWITSQEAYGFETAFSCRKGIKFAQVFSRGGFRLSSHAIQLFGFHARKNVVEVNEAEREDFIRGKDLKNRWSVDRGQVIVRYKGIPLGPAVVVEDMLKNQVPTARRVRG